MSKHIDHIRNNRKYFKMAGIAQYIGFSQADFSLLINNLPRYSVSHYKGKKYESRTEIVLPDICQLKLEELFLKLGIKI